MNFKTVLTLSLALAAVSPLLYSATNNKVQQPTSTTMNNQADGKVLGTMVVLNRNEIGAGELANKKTTNKQVRNFAMLMIREHGKNLIMAENLSKKTGFILVEDSKAKNLKNNGRKELAKLRKLNGAAFDRAYIDAMVNGHTEALVLVTGLINESSDSKVKNYLSKTKHHVQNHLNKAKDIQKNLQG